MHTPTEFEQEICEDTFVVTTLVHTQNNKRACIEIKKYIHGHPDKYETPTLVFYVYDHTKPDPLNRKTRAVNARPIWSFNFALLVARKRETEARARGWVDIKDMCLKTAS